MRDLYYGKVFGKKVKAEKVEQTKVRVKSEESGEEINEKREKRKVEIVGEKERLYKKKARQRSFCIIQLK